MEQEASWLIPGRVNWSSEVGLVNGNNLAVFIIHAYICAGKLYLMPIYGHVDRTVSNACMHVFFGSLSQK